MSVIANPTLVLLDCQMDQVESAGGVIDSDNAAVVRRIAALLQQARRRGWKVCHSQQAGGRGRPASAPIAPLRPSAKEAVFLRQGPSAFVDSYFHQVIARADGAPILLAGFSAPFSILATLFDAMTRDIEITLVPDAVGSLAVEPRSVAETRQVAFDLAGRIAPSVGWRELPGRFFEAEEELDAPVS
ncbi:isochorismatase family protein [Maricaulis sp. CAU 1757]